MSLSVHRPPKRSRTSQQGFNVNPMAFGMNPLIAGMLAGGMGMNVCGMGNNMGNFGNTMGGMGSMSNMGNMMGGNMALNGLESEEEEEGEHAANPAPAQPVEHSSASSETQSTTGASSNAIGAEMVSEDYHTKMSPNCLISRSVTYVKNLPRNRISECLEKISPGLEASYTAELSQSGLLCILWLYTRVKPSVKVTDLSH